MTAWADMLSMIGCKNSRLYDFVVRDSRPRATGGAIVEELERERSRIARELHAGVGQPLAGIKLNLEMLNRCADLLPPEGLEALRRLQVLTQQAFDQVRSVSHRLHPPEWQNLTTVEALRNLIDSSSLATRLTVEMDVELLPVEPPHCVKIAIYRCAQECISNITRHSDATRMRIALGVRGSTLELRVEDNGAGFDSADSGKGIGLVALREHSSALGGSCQITSGANGTAIVVKLPLSED